MSIKLKLAALVVPILLILMALMLSAKASALSGSGFNAGRIIDDQTFYNYDSMTTPEIQNFLNVRVPQCDTNGSEPSEYGGGTRAQYGTAHGHPPPYTCLKSYKVKMPAMAADSYCPGSIASSGDSTRTAAQIIRAIAIACHISPQTLIVTLQKEQVLVTDEWPFPTQYTKAMGYACPDTSGCDPAFAGFFKQVYWAAHQFRRYRALPDQYNYVAGIVNTIQWNPNAGCGSSQVLITSQATAGLYNYTPYRPNSAALANLYGSGDSCSSYGNRNFWRYFSDWFGNPAADTSKDKAIVGDWDRSPSLRDFDSPAVKRGNYYYFDNNLDGSEDNSFGIGKTTDIAVAGDWDGDDDKSIGLRRGDHYFLLTSSGQVQYEFGMGRTTDTLIVGDWNGDGTDSLGLKRGTSYYLDNNNDGKADVSFTMGRATDQVITGKWNGTNDGVGLKRGNYYYMDYNNDGEQNASLGIGRTTDQVFIGRWGNDGKDRIGLRRDNYYFFDTNGDGHSEIAFGVGRTTDKVIAGDWNHDNTDTVGLKRGSNYYLLSNDGSSYKSFVYTY